MALFTKKKRILGVDLGTSSVKLVELEDEAGRPKLVTYGFVEQQSDIIKDDSQLTMGRIVGALKTIVRQSHASTTRVVTALPSFAVFTSIISLPEMSRKELFSAVRWEAKKFVPMPLEEMVLDWRVLGQPTGLTPTVSPLPGAAPTPKPKGPKTMRVLLTAAPKSLVKRYLDIFKAAQLQIVSLETESFALERALIGNDKSAIMIVDMGAIATNIAIIVNNVPLLNRSIDVGGETITKAIASALNIDQNRAEQFKRDFGLATTAGSAQIPRTIEFVISSVITEIRYVLNLYQSQGERPIDKIVLAGGSAFLPHFPEYLEKLLGFKVVIGNPWARIAYPVELQPALEEIGPRMAVASGLALREIV
jgi:type IV pilus assembly protein PilM